MYISYRVFIRSVYVFKTRHDCAKNVRKLLGNVSHKAYAEKCKACSNIGMQDICWMLVITETEPVATLWLLLPVHYEAANEIQCCCLHLRSRWGKSFLWCMRYERVPRRMHTHDMSHTDGRNIPSPLYRMNDTRGCVRSTICRVYHEPKHAQIAICVYESYDWSCKS